VAIWLDAGALHLRYGGGEPATLEHWHHDTFRVHWSNPWHDADLSTLIAFTLDADRRVTQLLMEPFGDSIDARRLAE
jgi:hypothetical protein